MVESKFMYTICPSVRSVLLEMLIVMTMFFSLITYIIYLSAYDSGYKPNFVMFFNFLFDDTSSTKNFRTYVGNIAKDEFASHNQESFSNKSDFGNYISDFFKVFSGIMFRLKKQIITSFFVKGNMISVSQRI